MTKTTDRPDGPDTDRTTAAGHAATTTTSDAELAEQIRAHHAGMVDQLDRLTTALRDCTPEARAENRARLTDWFRTVLVPHADEEERTTYHATAELPAGAPLVQAMVREHVLIKHLVELFEDSDMATAAAYAEAVSATFESHQAKENEIILPMLLATPGVSLQAALGSAHDQQTGHSHDHAHHDHAHHDHAHHDHAH